MKKISVVIPTYNEEANIKLIAEAVINQIDLSRYAYELIFIDNKSVDNSRLEIGKLCSNNQNIKAIFNTRNFGQFNSPYYGILQSTGDCTILIAADFQDPVQMIPQFIEQWENGYKIVIGIKSTSKENKLMYFLRSIYYKVIKSISDVEQIEHFTGFGLYDKKFVDLLRSIKDKRPYFRGLVADIGYERKEIKYTQALRRAGKSSNNFLRLYDAAMVGFTSYTKVGLRISVFIGFFSAILSFMTGLAYLIYKLIYWNQFQMGLAPLIIGLFFLNSVVLFFLGFLGEYVLNINDRILDKPLVVEDLRLNFIDRVDRTE